MVFPQVMYLSLSIVLNKEGFYKGIDGCRVLAELSESELARRIYPDIIDLKDGDAIIVGRAKLDTYIPDFKEIANWQILLI